MNLCMWQSLPGPSLPPCSDPPPTPMCALPSPQVGDQILEVNGRSFLSIPHDEAVRVLKSSRHLMMTVKDVGRLPHARTVVGETKWITSSQIAESSANSSMAGWVAQLSSPSSGCSFFWAYRHESGIHLQLFSKQINLFTAWSYSFKLGHDSSVWAEDQSVRRAAGLSWAWGSDTLGLLLTFVRVHQWTKCVNGQAFNLYMYFSSAFSYLALICLLL